MTLEHKIDLSATPERPGQSRDLETKRRRLWERLDDRERAGAIEAYDTRSDVIEMPCLEAGGAYERVLYALVVTGKRLTPAQISYVLLSRWYHNTDPETIRSKLAAMVERDHAKWTKYGSYYATDAGVEHLKKIEYGWRSVRDTGRPAVSAATPQQRPGVPSPRTAPFSARPGATSTRRPPMPRQSGHR